MSGADPDPRPNAQPGAPGRHRQDGRPGEQPLAELGLGPFAELTLALMRLHFQTFADPGSQGWLRALHLATERVGPRAAGALCYDLVALVQALRTARVSAFRFNPETCACCRTWATPEERQLMELLAALRAGRTGSARALVQILCDGRPDEDLLTMADLYLTRHAPVPVR